MAGMNLRRRTRIALAGAGALVASMSVGCQGGGTQFASPFSPYRDSQVAPVHAPASPAFAQVQAGQNLPVGGQMMAQRNGMPAMPGQPIAPPQPMMVQQPIVGSGGMVYPIGYNPAMQSQMPAQQQHLANGMPVHPMMPQMQGQMPGQMLPQYQSQIQPQMPGQLQVVQGQPLQMNNAPPLPAGSSGQVQVSVIQGPNGPQYVYTEIVNSPNAPLGNGIPTSNNVAPYPTPAPASGSANGSPGAAPTFEAPLPNLVPAPAMPSSNGTQSTLSTPMTFVPAESNGVRPPETLPPAVSLAPAGHTGASLPGIPSANSAGPGGQIGSFPISPVKHTNPPVPTAPRLPTPNPANTSSDDDITSAPIFLPTAK
jgi:hypothetical protein